jgi:hypothetical protein
MLLWFLDASVCVLPRSCSDANYDRPPLKKWGFVSQDPTGGFSTKRECTNTHINIQYHDIQVIKQLLHIKCHVLWFTKDEAQKMVQYIYKSFCGSNVSHDKYTLCSRREWASSIDLHLWVPVGNPATIVLDLPLIALVGVAGRKRKILTCTQTKQNQKKQKLERLRSIRLICRDPKTMNYRHAKASSEILDISLSSFPSGILHFPLVALPGLT